MGQYGSLSLPPCLCITHLHRRIKRPMYFYNEVLWFFFHHEFITLKERHGGIKSIILSCQLASNTLTVPPAEG